MAIVENKTLAEHQDYVEQMCRLSFFTARRLKDQTPDEPVSELLRKHTPLFLHALNCLDYETHWHNPGCMRIAARADELAGLPAPEFEERMYADTRGFAMERAERFYPKSVGMPGYLPEDWNVGSLKYDLPKKDLPPSYCNFHIANALAPRSIYDDPAHLPACFMKLMDESEKEYGYDTLHTGTWLNDTPRWLALFPQEWINNLSERSDWFGWHFGYWGQLVTGRGTFNAKAGLYVREHVLLKYKCRGSRCSFSAMRRHLDNLGKSKEACNATVPA